MLRMLAPVLRNRQTLVVTVEESHHIVAKNVA